ncbi:hypothetical protein [Bacteroides thetaiotaomicron]|nr:hypothetical protein [Bacteroides thetaiotaomicron]MDC2165250.1 hypothetical protein [Bacteroides thetaiotaomicron]
MKYEELLKKKEWEEKRYEILARDNYTCQDCGCRGINNDIFFPISKISDLNKLLPDILLNGDNFESFCNGINWVDRSIKSPAHLQVEILNNKLCIYTIYAHDVFESPFRFVADNELSNIHFKEININDICLLYKDRKVEKGRLFAFLFTENMGQANYAAINYFCKNEKLEILELDILFENKYFHFSFSHLHFYNERILFKFTPLNIHHQYYIRSKVPWEYDNNALVTLCSHCHQKRHQQTSVPLYTLDRQLICSALPICERCHGTGYLPQFHYYMGGICFKCHGEGVYGYD